MERNCPLISIIMPVYNAECFIGRTIDSVLNQTIMDWELIITEDCSTDNTFTILQGYKDPRIKIYQTEKNTGTVYTPRENSFNYSSGKYVLNLDADDYIEKEYLQKLLGRLNDENADTCCGKMVMVNPKGDLLDKIPTIPTAQFDFHQVICGRDAFMHTVPKFKIAMNGCLSKRQIWAKAWNEYKKPGRRGIHEDENISRLILINSRKVVFSDACHFYTINGESVTHKFNDKIFDWMIAETDLLEIAKKYYGEGSEYKATELADYYAYIHAINFFFCSLNSINEEEKKFYYKKYRDWHNRINWEQVKKHENNIKWHLSRNYKVRCFCKLIQYHQYKDLSRLLLLN